MQLNHYNSKFNKKKFPIILVCDQVSNAPNIGSIFRTADAFGVEKIIFCGDNITIGRKVTKTSRATEKVVDYQFAPSAINVVEALKNNNYHIIALEITSISKSINNLKLETKKPIVLVIGDENFGVSPTLLNQADHTIHIDMYGNNSSMNVVQATTVALYEITKQLL